MIIYVIEQRKRSLNDVTICWAAYVSSYLAEMNGPQKKIVTS